MKDIKAELPAEQQSCRAEQTNFVRLGENLYRSSLTHTTHLDVGGLLSFHDNMKQMFSPHQA